MDQILRYRGYVALTLLYLVLFGGYVWYARRPQPPPLQISAPTAVPTPTLAPTETPAPVQVHVVGAVRRPGVYTLPSGSRIHEAVQAAGGLTEDADPERVNLADRLADGQQIYIPRQGTSIPPQPTALPAPTTAGATGGDRPSSEDSSGRLININTASAEELERLPGIGPAYAQRIIAYRQEHGPFTDPAQIMEVNGIGEARYAQIKDLITVR